MTSKAERVADWPDEDIEKLEEAARQTRRPVTLIYSERFANITDAIAASRKLKK
jgi:predicted GIY-YIG superfamily endonuclease